MIFSKLRSQGLSIASVVPPEQVIGKLTQALTRAADWLYVCHPEIYLQRSRGGWNSWDDDGHRELTRFLSWTAQEAFDHQEATEFVPPEQIVTEADASRG